MEAPSFCIHSGLAFPERKILANSFQSIVPFARQGTNHLRKHQIKADNY